MPKNALSLPSHGLSIANVTSDARHVQWGELGEPFGHEGYEIVLPTPTYGDWSDNAAPAPEHVERIAKRQPGRILSEDDEADFRATESYDSWRDGFDPLMNYAWPVYLAYEVSAEEAAGRMARFAGNTTLIELSDGARDALYGYGEDQPEHVISLTGGGMDLSADIATAYLCCGCVPPLRLLKRLYGSGRDVREGARPALRKAYVEAGRYLAREIATLREESRRVFPRKAKAV